MAAVGVRHSKVVTIPDDPNYPVGSDEWNENHVVTGLENVDNTADVNKPVSTAQAAAISSAVAAVTKASIGLGSVDNTSDASKPVSTAQAAADAVVAANAASATALKADIASPTLTGTPTAPTAAPGTNTTQISTTAFVQAAVAALIAGAPGALDTLKELADAINDDASFAATITSALALKAPLASPTLTGTPTAPTAAAGTNTTQLATTAFVGANSVEFSAAQSLSAAQKAQARTNIAAVLKGHIFGLTFSTAGASATFGVAAGEAADSTAADLMALASAYTKTTAAWAVGTATGALDTGAIAASTQYHFFLIKRPDTGVVDLLISLSPTAPTLPTNYTLFRRLCSIRTNASSQWVKVIQTGDDFLLDVAVNDVNAGAITTTNTVYTLGSIPTGISVLAFLRIVFTCSTTGQAALVSSALTAAQLANTPVGNSNAFTQVAGGFQDTETRIWTNTSAQVNASGTSASGNQLYLTTFGWSDRRGRDA